MLELSPFTTQESLLFIGLADRPCVLPMVRDLRQRSRAQAGFRTPSSFGTTPGTARPGKLRVHPAAIDRGKMYRSTPFKLIEAGAAAQSGASRPYDGLPPRYPFGSYPAACPPSFYFVSPVFARDDRYGDPRLCDSAEK